MKKQILVSTFALAMMVFFTACSANAATVKLKAFAYSPPAQPPAGTVGESYDKMNYSFCSPRPTPGQFCGKVLPKNKVSVNPHDGSPNYTFSAGVGLPFGLTLNLNGNLGGTPKKAGDYNFKICASDRVGKKICHSVRMRINEKTNYPQAAILLTTGATNMLSATDLIDTVTQEQFNSSFGRIVRSFKISAPGLTIVPKPRQDIEQIHNCFDTKNCGGACGLCFGPEWTLNNPAGDEVRLNLLGMNYDAQKNRTTFKLGIMGADSFAFKDALLVGTNKLPGGGLVFTVRLTYDQAANGSIVTKTMPDFQITIGPARSISLEERKKLEQSGKIETISW